MIDNDKLKRIIRAMREANGGDPNDKDRRLAPIGHRILAELVGEDNVDVAIAFCDGKPIEIRPKARRPEDQKHYGWVETDTPHWSDHAEYRTKPDGFGPVYSSAGPTFND